jgi:hypothetical protein
VAYAESFSFTGHDVSDYQQICLENQHVLCTSVWLFAAATHMCGCYHMCSAEVQHVRLSCWHYTVLLLTAAQLVLNSSHSQAPQDRYEWRCLTIIAAFLLGQSAAVLTCSLKKFGATYLSSVIYFRLVTATVALALIA